MDSVKSLLNVVPVTRRPLFSYMGLTQCSDFFGQSVLLFLTVVYFPQLPVVLAHHQPDSTSASQPSLDSL